MAGAGYKLFNSGDVLTAAQVNTYLMEQTVMVFNDAAARTTALSGVLSEGMISYLKDTNATEVYNGSAWVGITGDGDITGVTAGTGLSGGGTSGDVTLTNTVATTFDAKGDLVVGTGADTFAKLTAGTNDFMLVADSGQSTGLKYAGTWTTWTPTYTNLTVGNGTVTARYFKVGKMVYFDYKIIFGSTTTMSGVPRFTLPSNSKSDVFFFDGNILDSGVANYNGAGQVITNTNEVYWKVYSVGGTYLTAGNVSQTAPMTWATNDEYQLHGFYEEA